MKKTLFSSTCISVFLVGVLLVTACEPQAPIEQAPIETAAVAKATNQEVTATVPEATSPVATAVPPGQIVLAQNLKILGPTTIEKIVPTKQITVTARALNIVPGGVISFTGVTKSMVALDTGDVLVSGVTEKTPFGLLRKVTNVNGTASGVEVDTEQATLEDAIEEGDFSHSEVLELPPQSAQTYPQRHGLMKVMPIPSSAQTSIQLKDVVLWDADNNKNTKGDQVIANGDILIKPEYEFHVQISGFSMKKMEFKNMTSVKSTVQIHADLDIANIHPSVLVYHHTFDPKEFLVGALPIVITPELNVYLGLDGEVSAGISTGVTHTADITLGANWENGKWDLPRDYNSHFDVIPPTVKKRWQARVYVQPRLDLLLYGVKGPYGQVNGYFELNVSPSTDPWWVMHGGIEAEVGVEFKIFKFLKKVSFSQKFQLYRDVVAQAPTATIVAPTSIPTEEPTAVPTEEPTAVPVTCTYLATFVKDVTIPDNTLVAAGTGFVKTWRLRNDGSCTWGPDGLALVFTGGDQLGGPDQVPISTSVAPGQTIDVSVNLVAPTRSGTYTSEWMLTMDGLPADLGPYLGVGTSNQPLFARIVVGSATVLDSVTRIRFETGGTAAVINDSAKAGNVKGYRLRALAGQILIATLTSNPSNVRLSIFAADGRLLQVTTSSDESYLLAYLPTNQDYTVVVSAGSQKINYTLEIMIPSWIQFPIGAYSDSVDGTISNHLPVSYILRAGKGQTMTVKVTSPDNVALTIYGLSDGKTLTQADSDGLSNWSGKLPATQDYIVQVVPKVNSTTFTLEVTIK